MVIDIAEQGICILAVRTGTRIVNVGFACVDISPKVASYACRVCSHPSFTFSRCSKCKMINGYNNGCDHVHFSLPYLYASSVMT